MKLGPEDLGLDWNNQGEEDVSDFRWPWEPRRFKHRHAMLPVAVQIGERSEVIGGMMAAASTDMKLEVSIVLRRCECGEFDSVSILGTWTLDQIQGRNEATKAVEKLLAENKP